MFREVLCHGLRASGKPLRFRVPADIARGKCLQHTSTKLGSATEHDSDRITGKIVNEHKVQRVSWVWNAYSDEEAALLKKLLSEGKTCTQIAPQFPGRSIASLRLRGRGFGTYVWSQNEYDLLSRGIHENLSNEEIRQKYLPSRSIKSIQEKRRRGQTQRDNAWSDVEEQALLRLRAEGKTIAQIRKTALPHRSERGIKARILQLIAEQKLKPYVGINYGYTAEDVENLKIMHAEGLDNGQIAVRLNRTAGSVISKLRLLGIKHNRTKNKLPSNRTWSKTEDEQLTPFLRKVVAVKDMCRILPDRSEDTIRGRMAKLRKQLGIQLREKGPAWTEEEIAQLRAFQEHRNVNNGLPSWEEVARRLGRTLPSISLKLGVLRREAKRAKQAHGLGQPDGE